MIRGSIAFAIITKPQRLHMLRGAGLLAGLALSVPTGPAQAPAQPNILRIMSDDHAAHAIGACGGRLASLYPDLMKVRTEHWKWKQGISI